MYETDLSPRGGNLLILEEPTVLEILLFNDVRKEQAAQNTGKIKKK